LIKEFSKYFICSLGFYAGILVLLLMTFSLRGEWATIVNFDFLTWDAKHLKFLAFEGYDFPRSAFYPLFPFFWKLTSFSPLGVSIFNGVLFTISFSLMAAEWKIELRRFIIYLATPSLLFMFLPYSEAFLFFFSVLFLIAIKRDSTWLLIVSVFLMSLTKPTASILLPTIVLAEYLSNLKNHFPWKRMFLAGSVIICANFLVYFVQFLATNEWFTFFQAQAEWGNRLSIPSFPLGTWNQPHIIWIDAAALWFCSLAIVIGVAAGYQKFFQQKTSDRVVAYTVLYLAGTGLFVLLFRSGSLFSLNRFVFAVPFFFVGLEELRKVGVNNSTKLFFSLVAGFLLYSLLFGSYQHIQQVLLYALFGIFLSLWTCCVFMDRSKIFSGILLVLLIICQIFYFTLAIRGEWVG